MHIMDEVITIVGEICAIKFRAQQVVLLRIQQWCVVQWSSHEITGFSFLWQ